MTQTQAPARTAAQARNRPDYRPSPRLEPKASVRLTGRGAIAALFVMCLVTQLVADWGNWGTVAAAAFVCGCGAVAFYTRTSGLRAVVVSPPLVFLAGCGLAQAITAPGSLLAAEQTLVTLGTSAPWLFTATALTVIVAIGRGYQPALSWRSARSRGPRRR
jgi:hypothetical protein